MTQDSNVTGFYIAEEASLKVLPETPVWYRKEPNSYSDFGAETSMESRAPIDTSRQRKKGKIVDVDASGGFNTDITESNLVRDLQGFFFADAREKTSTQPLNGAAIELSAVTVSSVQAASGLDAFAVGQLVKLSGMGSRSNNGVATVTAVAAGELTVDKALTAEAAPPATAKVEVCGFAFADGDVDIVASASRIALESSTVDLTTLGLTVGEWVFIGGDAENTAFANNSAGYARVSSIATDAIELDDSTFTASNEDGAGTTLELYFGTVIRNEKELANIKKRSYNLERQLGYDDNGIQSEYVVGAVPNELTINLPEAAKLTADLTYVGMDSEFRSGQTGIKAGTRVEPFYEDAYNSTSDLYRVRLAIVDPVNLNNKPLFGYATEGDISVANGVSANKALGVLGGFDTDIGDFEVGGSITAYFSNIESVEAVRKNSDISFNVIGAQKNTGFVFDIPLIGLSSGRLNIEKDTKVTLPLEMSAGENEAGYTMLYTYFPYLPDIAMPD